MYIKLTRLDGTPIWLNAAFIVTIEPRKQGGAVVVPIGDGLDYDVRESTEQVLAMLAEQEVSGCQLPVTGCQLPVTGCQLPVTSSQLPVTSCQLPVTSCQLPVTSCQNNQQPATGNQKPETINLKPESADDPKPTKRRRTKKAAAVEGAPEPADDPKPTKRRRTKKAADVEGESAHPLLTDEQVERLKHMAPRSRRKLLNTLAKQFRVDDAEAVMGELLMRGIFTLEQEHVIWKNI